MEVLIAIVAWVALVLAGFAMLTALMLANELIKKNSENHINTDTVNTDDVSEDFKEGWSQAINFMMSSINITMFDLYRTHDVLDYESNTEEFMNRINHIIENDRYREDTINEYQEYMKGREE